MYVYCRELLSIVSGWWTGGWTLALDTPSRLLAEAGEAQRSHCQNLSTSKYNLAEAVGCWNCLVMSRRLGPGTRS